MDVKVVPDFKNDNFSKNDNYTARIKLDRCIAHMQKYYTQT